jgi:hypothetical protein
MSECNDCNIVGARSDIKRSMIVSTREKIAVVMDTSIYLVGLLGIFQYYIMVASCCCSCLVRIV